MRRTFASSIGTVFVSVALGLGASYLRRELNTFTLTLYGVGVMVGAGVYVLIGKVSSIVGNALPTVMVLAAIAALPTGLTYASLASRYPKSAGGLRRSRLSQAFPLLRGRFSDSGQRCRKHGGGESWLRSLLGKMFDFDVSAHGFIIFGFLSILSVINYRGIRESTWVNVASTLISVAALLVIAFAGMAAWGRAQPFEVIPPEGAEVYALLIVVASALAFYAYIGFEDICNVAEEVKDPERTILRATMLAVAITTVLYLLIGLTVISVAASDVPLALVARRLLPSLPSGWIHVVALFAILYGLARDGLLPKRFGRISDERQTPIVGVMFAFALAFIVAVTGFLRFLAEATSVILLSAFFLVNAALIVVKVRRIPSDNPKIEPFDVPMFVPLLGLATTGYLVVQFSAGAYLRLGLLMGFGLALYGFQRLGLRLSAPGSKLV